MYVSGYFRKEKLEQENKSGTERFEEVIKYLSYMIMLPVYEALKVLQLK